MLDVKIAPGGSRPIYRQIIDQVKQAVGRGELAVGDPLPSVRSLAEELVVNHNTVAKAYAELIRDGMIESRQGRGVFVAKRRTVYSAGERKRRFEQALAVFLTEVVMLEYTTDQIKAEVAKGLEKMVAAKA